MPSASLLLLALVAVLQVAVVQPYEYSDEDVELAEALDGRLQHCLGGLPVPEPDPRAAIDANDLPNVAWLPVAKVRQHSPRRRPGDICREETMDVVWEDGSAEEGVSAATTCLLNHYNHVMTVDGIAAAIKKGLQCVAAELRRLLPPSP